MAGVFNPAAATTTDISPRFRVHSTYRHATTGKQLYPRGLQWGLGGKSHLAYYYETENNKNDNDSSSNESNSSSNSIDKLDLDSPATKWALVQAHNRWAFSQQRPFVLGVQDILKVEPFGDHHVQVEWNPRAANNKDQLYDRPDLAKLLTDMVTTQQQQQDNESDSNEAASSSPPQVWINGEFAGILQGTESVDSMLQAVKEQTKIKSRRLCLIRSADGSVVRIERKFKGYLMNRNIVFEHVWDNLLAMEDVELVDNSNDDDDDDYNYPGSGAMRKPLIGTATLPDWIMGGRLTSRIWIQELDNGNICFERPLYEDRISTSDRTFELHKGRTPEDDEMIRIIQPELDRLRRLAQVAHPYYVQQQQQQQVFSSSENSVQKEDPALEQRRQQHRQNQRRRFGL